MIYKILKNNDAINKWNNKKWILHLINTRATILSWNNEKEWNYNHCELDFKPSPCYS